MTAVAHHMSAMDDKQAASLITRMLKASKIIITRLVSIENTSHLCSRLHDELHR